ncbi:putative serine carboxypeptidase CPVL-like protein, partial [Leptotrombidium deliense]
DVSAPILLWLQGGPGASSMFGLFIENGPFQITKHCKIECRKYSWTKSFSMLYIDQPVGTGFSFTDDDKGYAKNLNESTDNVYNALNQFFLMFNELSRNEFYVTGESYAGKFAPALAYKIQNDINSKINLKGIAVGNAFVDPISYLDLNSLLYEMSLIDKQQRRLFEAKEMEIKELIKQEQLSEAFKKYEILFRNSCNGKSLFFNFTGYNSYYSLIHQNEECGSERLSRFLNKCYVKKQLHVGNRTYKGDVKSNFQVVTSFMKDYFLSAKEMLSVVMDNYRVMLYSGNLDIIVAPVFNNRFLNNLRWKHRDEYLKAERKIWRFGKEENIVGYIKNVANFYEVIIRNSGHMVPLDKPEAAFEMIQKFVNNQL